MLAVLGGAGVLAGILFSRPGPEARAYRGKSIKAWALQLNASSPPARAEAAAAFTALGTNAVPGLVRLLEARDSFSRRGLLSLATKLPSRLRGRVLKWVRDPEARMVRSAAARALAVVGPGAEAAVPALARALRTDEAHVRWEAAAAL